MQGENLHRLTRRKFLENSSALGLALLPGLIASESFGQSKPKKVLVLGAGISGMACAKTLQEAGFDVRVLEGRHRVGGRIWTDRSLGLPLDLGASFIEGSATNPLEKLAALAKSKTKPLNDEAALFTAEGELKEEAYKTVSSARLEILQTLKEQQTNAKPRETMDSVIRELLRKRSYKDEILAGVLWHLFCDLEIESGADASQIAYETWDTEKKFSGNDTMVVGGYDRLVDYAASGVPIDHHQTVKKIKITNNGVLVTAAKLYEADFVVVTFPVGVLQKGDIEFDPGFEKPRAEALSRMTIGTINKYFMIFPHSFWPEEVGRLGYVQQGYRSMAEYWNVGTLLDLKTSVLMAVTRGDYAESLEEKSKQQTMVELTSDLRSMFGNSIPWPENTLLTRWKSDSYSRGSHSIKGIEFRKDDPSIISEPILDRIFFAGEATSMEYPSSVHGAYLSGIREARKIMRLPNKSRQ